MNEIIFPNPCEYVKTTCRKVSEKSSHIKINKEEIKTLSLEINSDKVKLVFPPWSSSHFDPSTVEIETLLRYIMVIDTLNFCFWPNKPFEYYDLSHNLYITIKDNPKFFSIENLKNINEKQLEEQIFKTKFNLIEERARMLREVFTVISINYNNSCYEFIKKSDKNAVKLVKSIIDNFPCFRDESIYKGEQVFLYKRAQILVSDLYLCYIDLVEKQGKNGENEILNFNNSINELTMFADYRVPQILRSKNILIYDNELENIIDNNIEICHSDEFEIEIRACTVIAVEEIKNELKKYGKNFMSLEIDAYLWEEGEKIKNKIKPAHKTLSIFY